MRWAQTGLSDSSVVRTGERQYSVRRPDIALEPSQMTQIVTTLRQSVKHFFAADFPYWTDYLRDTRR